MPGGGTCQQQLLGLAEMRRAEASAKHQLQRDLRGLERAYARLERSNAKLQTDLDVSVTGWQHAAARRLPRVDSCILLTPPCLLVFKC